MMKQLGVDPTIVKRTVVALYEAEVNIVAHAYRGTIYVDLEENHVYIKLDDEGPGIPDINKAVPDCLFRVGEMMFNDEAYSSPENREMLKEGVRKHLQLIGSNTAYSETTVFPAASMSIDNFLHRMNTEIELGLRNIFLMSGTWFYSEPYWNAIIRNREAMEEKALRLDERGE